MRTIKSAERTLALLELFSERETGLTVGQIAEELGVPQPSISMLVRNLTALGYLDHDQSTRTYIPSIRVVLLGSWIERKFGDTQSLVKRLDDIQRRVNETSYIGIQNGVYAQYVMVQRASKQNRLDVQSGNIVHLTCCAFGRALLSLKGDGELSSLAKRCNAEVDDDRLKIGHAELQRIMVDIRKKGYARTSGARVPGTGAIAMTFKLPSMSIPLAVGVGGSVQSLERKSKTIIASLREFKEAFEK